MGVIVDTILVQGLLLLEAVYPMPKRLGKPQLLSPTQQELADPVILVGGFANSPSGWGEWARSLRADGFQVYIFDPPTVGLGDMYDSARAVAKFIEDVRRRTGRVKVDIIGFSEGGLLTRIAINRYGALGAVDRAISLASPHAGVPARGLYDALIAVGLPRSVLPESASQLISGSKLIQDTEREDRLLRTLKEGSTHARAPRYASVFSRTIDLFTWPQSGWLQGAFNIPVGPDKPGGRDPNHFDMLHLSDRAYEAIRVLLTDGHNRDAARIALTSLGR